jgi:hypothetical protein
LIVGTSACRPDAEEPTQDPPPASLPSPSAVQPPQHFISEFDRERLLRRGLTHPVSDLIADRQARPELIPHPGVLGGTMRFFSKQDIHVLNARWVYAYVEDGHVSGWALLHYDVGREGRIAWRLIESFID